MPSSVSGLVSVEKNLQALRRRGLRDPQLHDLTDLVGIARQLSDKLTDPEIVEDALAQGIDACWGSTREDIPTTRDAMRLWFGLAAVDDPNAPNLRTQSSRERNKAAWEYLESGRLSKGQDPKETYETFRTSKAGQRYKTLAKKLIYLGQHVPAESQPAVMPATAVVDAAPAHQPAQQPNPPATEAGWRQAIPYGLRASLRRTLLLVATLVVAAGFITWALWPAKNSYANPNTVPPEGAVVNAENGAVLMHATIKPTRTPVELAQGQLMLACIVSSSIPCHYASTLKVHVGDIIKFSVMLVETQDQLIPYLKLTTESVGLPRQISIEEPINELSFRLSVHWPYALEEGSHIQDFLETSTQLQFPNSKAYRLSYIPSSTQLLAESGHLVHDLPNGIMENGIALQDVGSPPGCLDCELQYLRYVNFKAKVEVTK